MIERKSLPAAERAKITQALRDLVRREGLSVLGWNTKNQDFLARAGCAQPWLCVLKKFSVKSLLP